MVNALVLGGGAARGLAVEDESICEKRFFKFTLSSAKGLLLRMTIEVCQQPHSGFVIGHFPDLDSYRTKNIFPYKRKYFFLSE